MSLEWSAVAVWLYLEVFITYFFIYVPTISRWSIVFRSELANFIESRARVYIASGAAVLCLLFVDAIRQVREYSYGESKQPVSNAQADTLVHLRLFRAQRNFYISGFALFLWLVIHRVIELIKQGAELEVSANAAKFEKETVVKQSEGLQREYNRLCFALSQNNTTSKIDDPSTIEPSAIDKKKY